MCVCGGGGLSPTNEKREGWWSGADSQGGGAWRYLPSNQFKEELKKNEEEVQG